ncbi:hypothetical protein M9H77_35948 [Catharanthus roseus]|uniref:Uncharacterized protein n=1 Tax=Catharanthus roseus TaxID=4058 RepID=A0ACB9ZSC5_CATRO|nr:hypothetical protein M9H77_35948 [Catharanthus roseus]
MWGMIPSNIFDPFVGNFLVKKVQGYLCSLIGDLLNKSIRRNVERCSYVIPSFETFVIVLKEISPFENYFLNVEVQLESHCDEHTLLIGIEVLKAFLIETILDLQFYLLHFEESMFLLICENMKKKNSTDLRTNHFKGGADGMTRDKHENMESFQGSITSFQGPVARCRARMIEEETRKNKFGKF